MFLPSPKVPENQRPTMFLRIGELVEEHVRGLEDPGTNEDGKARVKLLDITHLSALPFEPCDRGDQRPPWNHGGGSHPSHLKMSPQVSDGDDV